MVKDHGLLGSPEPDRLTIALVRSGPGTGGQASVGVANPNRSGQPQQLLQGLGFGPLHMKGRLPDKG